MSTATMERGYGYTPGYTDGWTDTTERTGTARLGEQNLGGLAATLSIGKPKELFTRDVWGQGGRVSRGLEATQVASGHVDSFMKSGLGRALKKTPVVGRVAHAVDKGATLVNTASSAIDSFGGVDGVIGGVKGALHDPRVALDIAKQGGLEAVAGGARAAALNLGEQVGITVETADNGERRKRRVRLNLGRVAKAAAELVATGGASGVAMLTEAGMVGVNHGIGAAKDRMHQMPSQFAGILDKPGGDFSGLNDFGTMADMKPGGESLKDDFDKMSDTGVDRDLLPWYTQEVNAQPTVLEKRHEKLGRGMVQAAMALFTRFKRSPKTVVAPVQLQESDHPFSDISPSSPVSLDDNPFAL